MPSVNQEVVLSKYLGFSKVQLESDSHHAMSATTVLNYIKQKGHKTQATHLLDM